MPAYKTTASFTARNGKLYEVVFTGFASNDGGQSDVEGPTSYFIDGEEVSLDESLSNIDCAILGEIAKNFNNCQKFKLTTEWGNSWNFLT